MLVFGSEDEKATDPAFRDQVEPLEEDERVTSVRTAYENGATNEAMISRNGHYSLVVIELEEGGFAELQDALCGRQAKGTARPARGRCDG